MQIFWAKDYFCHSFYNNVINKNKAFIDIIIDCYIVLVFLEKQGRKRPLDTPKRMIERREREEREIKVEGEI